MAESLAGVIRRLGTIEASAPGSDGVVCLSRLYREVTEDVGNELTRQGFADSRFLETLDIRFAGLFFSALESYGRDPKSAPPAWVPSFAAADRLVHRLRRIDDVVAMWDVERARDAAWTNAQALWARQDEPRLAADYLLALDRMVGLAGRGLLVPADSWLLKLGRALSR